jgi:thiamine biosynthesis lipoprotein
MTIAWRKGVLPLALLLLLAGALWWRPAVRPEGRSQILMGTVVEIEILDPETDQSQAAIDAAFAEMARIEALMTPHRPDSDVTRLSAAQPYTTPARETLEVIAAGAEISRISGGAFDLGLGCLIHLWGFAEGEPHRPTDDDIHTALNGVGPGDVAVVDGQVRKSRPDLQLDLGAIAKGYAVDRAVAILQAAGIQRATVNAGGDIRLLGDHQGRPWRIGIQHPRQPQAVLATLLLADVAVVTSGDYERAFDIDGVRYHHLLDPRTGLPARGCQSVTIVAKTAMQADALATAAFVLGPVDGLALLERLPAVEGLIVAADGSTHLTGGLAERVQWP